MNLADIEGKYKQGIIDKQEYIQLMHAIHLSLFEYADFIKSRDIKNIEISDGCVIMTSRLSSIKMIVSREDEREAPIEILNFGFYEKADFDMVMNLVDGCRTAFDIGANIGWYSLNIAKAKRGIKVLSFEPIPETFASLRRNIEINKIDNIETFNFGFSDEDKETEFYYCNTLSGNASLVDLSTTECAQKIRCKVVRLDDFVFQNNYSVDFLKCDVEGAELLVFKGGIETIKRDKPIIFSEMLRKWSAKFGYHPSDIIRLLSEIGYVCFTTQKDQLVKFSNMDNNTTETNFFFLHSDNHDSKIRRLIRRLD